MTEVKTAELVGAALDWAAAHAVSAWESAHTLYPAMTLDPKFSGVEPRPYPRGEFGAMLMTCVLVPNNPFRQDPQAFCPSTEWSHGGPLIDMNQIAYLRDGDDYVAVISRMENEGFGSGPTHLIAAMRAIVSAKLGDVLSVPSELVECPA